MDRLKGKVAIITGAAKGLGAADARLFVAEGARVILTDVDDAAGSALAAELGASAEYHHLDVTSEAAWAALIAAVAARHGRLDVLVNNAGIVEFGDPETLTEAAYRKIMGVSLDGVVFGTKHAIPAMAANGGGSIVNMASIAAIQGEPTFPAYCAAKGAIDAYTRATAAYSIKKGRGVRCNSVLPGGIDTPMVRSLPAKLADLGAAAPVHDAATAMNRLGDPADVAHLVLFLASDESRFINGQSHVIDDGASIIAGSTVPRTDR
ncbi:SDR family oxidoreductase [Novosphingobium sp.]|uniref:SDR family oxidoreductase n=1 Tax=Novosphingobium sp. TaxID=1874826 RepID=UPI003BACB0DC